MGTYTEEEGGNGCKCSRTDMRGYIEKCQQFSRSRHLNITGGGGKRGREGGKAMSYTYKYDRLRAGGGAIELIRDLCVSLVLVWHSS